MSETRGTFVDVFTDRVAASGAGAALRYKKSGQWVDISWNEWNTLSRELAAGLIAMGARPGDKANIQSNTRWEWVITDIGILMAGCVSVPIYQSNLPDQCQYIIDNSDARFVFVEDPHQLEKLLEVRHQIPKVERVIVFADTANLDKPDHAGRTTVTMDDIDTSGAQDWFITLDDLLLKGRSALESGQDTEVDSRCAALTSESTCTIVYTSGTTGNPKGVVLTHGNFAFECEAVMVLGIEPADTQLLFLPLAHIFAKVMYAAFIRLGAVTAFAESVLKAVGNMGEVKPTVVASVPRIYEKIHTKVLAGANSAGGLKLKIFNWANDVANDICVVHSRGAKPGPVLKLKHNVAMKLVGGKLHDIFGGRIRIFVSGGAPLSSTISRFFFGFGLEILEGYGLTETTAATHVNRTGHLRFGSVGQPLEGVEVRLGDDGEILVRGPNVMKDYYKLPEATAEVISSDNWFHTGDIGEIDADGYLKITDRKKDIIVTAGGKNIAPQNIENHFKTHPLISQVMVHGDKRNFLSALITLEPENIADWAKEKDVAFSDLADLAGKPEIYALVEGILKDKNSEMASYETVKKFAILEEDFSQDNGELTPTLKVKRKFVTEKHKALLDSFYTEKY